MAIGEMTEQEQVLCYKIEDELVEARVLEEGPAKEYAAACIARAREYQAKIGTMQIPLYMTVWVSEMTARTRKSEVKVHHNYLPWLAAFLVSRYGEAVSHWPAALSSEDLKRAREWKTGAGRGMSRAVVA